MVTTVFLWQLIALGWSEAYANSKGADQTVQLHSLIRALAICIRTRLLFLCAMGHFISAGGDLLDLICILHVFSMGTGVIKGK